MNLAHHLNRQAIDYLFKIDVRVVSEVSTNKNFIFLNWLPADSILYISILPRIKLGSRLLRLSL